MSEGGAGSSLGLDSNLAGLLCYLVGFISGVLFVLLEKQDGYVRFHAYQSLAAFGALFVISVVAGFVPVVGGLLAMLVSPVSLIVWILMMVKAYQGERYKLPVVGDWAEQQAAA